VPEEKSVVFSAVNPVASNLLPSALRDKLGGLLANVQPLHATVWRKDVLLIILPYFQINVFILEQLSALIIPRLYRRPDV